GSLNVTSTAPLRASALRISLARFVSRWVTIRLTFFGPSVRRLFARMTVTSPRVFTCARRSVDPLVPAPLLGRGGSDSSILRLGQIFGPGAQLRAVFQVPGARESEDEAPLQALDQPQIGLGGKARIRHHDHARGARQALGSGAAAGESGGLDALCGWDRALHKRPATVVAPSARGAGRSPARR